MPDASQPLDLLSLDELQAFQDSLITVTGLHVSCSTPSGQPLIRPAPLPPICRILRQSVCREPMLLCAFTACPSRRLLVEGRGAYFSQCPYFGLHVAAIPLKAHNACLALLVCGRVPQPVADGDEWIQKAQRLRIDESHLWAALQETPAIDEMRFHALIAHVEMWAQSFSQLAEARLGERRASRALQVTNRRFSALVATAASIMRSSTWQESLGEALQTILDVLQLDGGAIFLHGEGDATTRLVAHRGVRPEFVALGESGLLPDQSAFATLRASREPWIVPNATREPGLPTGTMQQLQIGAFVAVPLWAAEEAVGLLTVHCQQPRAFQPEEIALIAAAGEQLGLGVQGQRLLTAEKRRAGELAILNEVAVAVGKSLDLQVIVDQALDAVLRHFRAGAGLLYLLDDQSQALSLVSQRGLSAEFVRHWAKEPPVGWDAGQGIEDAARWGWDVAAACSRPDLVAAEGLVTYVSAPLRGQRRTGGLLVAFTREPRILLANEVELFQAVAHEIGLAVENAQLYRETQRRLADLEALQRFNERILHTMQEGIFIVDAQGKITYATPRLDEMTGYGVGEIIGQDWRRFIPAEDQESVQQFQTPVLGGRNVRNELDLVCKDGSLRRTSIGTVPLSDGGGVTGVLGVVTDLTEEVQLRRRLRQAEKLSAVGELVSGVAHELNNPLTVIRGYAQLLQGREDIGPAGRELQAISEHAGRAARIVQGLLTFARERPPARDEVDLNAVLQSVLDMRERQLITSGIRVVRELTPGLPSLRGDPYQLQQVFLNIISNAEQAMAEVGRGGEITIRTELAEEAILAMIRDTGPGIPAAIADRIFDPFFTTKADRQGTGLGLSICYGIVNAHGGRIWADSTEGQGAAFYIALPVPASDWTAPGEPQAARAVTEPSTGSHILVLEDELEIALLIARSLEKAGYRVMVAQEAPVALEAIHQADFDLIMTDLKMPGMNGREFYAQLCKAKPHLARRVIFVTGDIVSPDTQAFLSQAGRPHLAKPFSLDEMHELVLVALHEAGESV